MGMGPINPDESTAFALIVSGKSVFDETTATFSNARRNDCFYNKNKVEINLVASGIVCQVIDYIKV